MKKEKQTRASEALADLRKLIKAGDTVYTVVHKVAPSGMSRSISLYIVKKHSILNITGYVGDALDYPRAKAQGLRVGGCGMDMGYHLVSSLAGALGYTTKGAQSDGNCYGLKHQWL